MTDATFYGFNTTTHAVLRPQGRLGSAPDSEGQVSAQQLNRGDPMRPTRKTDNPVEYTDGFTTLQGVYVVIRRNPDRFRIFLSREEAKAHEGELWTRHMYEAAGGGVNNWSNFVKETR